jgi:hypothetical protein
MFRFSTGLALTVICASVTFAGRPAPFTALWNGELSGDVNDCYVTEDGSVAFGIGRKSVTALDGQTGKVAATAPLSDIIGKKDIDEQLTLSGADKHVLLFKLKGKDPVDIVAVDIPSCKKLWTVTLDKPDFSSSVYLSDLQAVAIPINDTLVLVNAADGKILWKKPAFFGKIMRNLYLPDQKLLLTISYLPGGSSPFAGLAATFTLGRTQVSCINVETGATVWDNVYKIVGATQGPSEYQKDYIWIKVEGEQVLLMLDYINVLDLKTGKEIWKLGVATEKSFGGDYVLQAQQLPMVHEGFIYETNFMHDAFKLDRTTGATVWKAEIPKSDYLTKVVVDNGVAVVQRGGYICKEGPITINGHLIGYKSSWETKGPYGLTAFDDKTGKQVWATEKFKGGLTRMILDNGLIYCCSGDSMYCIKVADGTAKYAVIHKTAKIGETRWAFPSGDNIVVVGEKGACAYAKADGKRAWTTNCDKIEDYAIIGENFFANDGDDEYTGIDLATGAVKGAVKKKDYDGFAFSPDGNTILAVKGKKATKFKVGK